MVRSALTFSQGRTQRQSGMSEKRTALKYAHRWRQVNMRVTLQKVKRTVFLTRASSIMLTVGVVAIPTDRSFKYITRRLTDIRRQCHT